ncbi:MAG TPA: M20/M25/M40 family metallo-hydrolase [Pyrinomonadaceae bacterium]|nr:M20/M25/M40 family metallo-hydrolase [Pyrinomonadaceae bacterium]
MKRFVIPIAALLVTSLVAVAQQAELEPSAARLQQHVTYLASDALDGRRTGTAGANDAARYIAGEFSRLGLRPANRNAARTARYMQSFPYVAGVELGRGNIFAFGSYPRTNDSSLQVGVDWLPLGFSTSTKVEGGIVFAGFGITAAELNYDDYAGLNATGKIAVALQGTPDGNNPHGQFAMLEGVRWKAIAARNAGAKALVIVAKDIAFSNDRLTKLNYDNNAGDAGIPIVVISRQAADKLLSLSNTSLEQIEQSTTAKKPGTNRVLTGEIALSTDVVRNEVPAYNVIGVLEGSDPVLKNENIVIGAHYDHLGRGGSGSLAPRSGEIHYGADDNASGTAGLLELARVFSAQRPRMKRTIIFIAFGGEEEGLLGSNYYVDHPLMPLANTVAMINMDMIGRMKDRKLVIGGVGTAKEWREIIKQANTAQEMKVTANSDAPAPRGVPIVVSANGRPIMTVDPNGAFELTLNEDGYGPSDHNSFYRKQIPVLFFWTGTHNDYHKPSDTFEKINYNDEARILSLVARIVRDVDGAEKRLTYTTARSDATPRTGGFRVYLGTIPNYADSTDGLLIDGVRDNSPAAKAGLKAGDRIVKIGIRDVKNVYDYTFALGEMKAGQEYTIEVKRGDEKLTLKITPESRK